MIVKRLQKLNFLQPLESFYDKIFLINLCPDKDEQRPGHHGDQAEHGAERLSQVYQKMEEETRAAEDEGQDEHDVHSQPGDDQAAAAARGGDHKEDRGGEAEHEGDEDPGQDGGGGGGPEELPGAGDEAGVGEDEDEDGGAAEEEILDTQTRPQHLQQAGGALEAGCHDNCHEVSRGVTLNCHE